MTSCEKPLPQGLCPGGSSATQPCLIERLTSWKKPGVFVVTDCKNQQESTTRGDILMAFDTDRTRTGQRKNPTLRGSWDHVISQCVHDCCILQNLLGCRCFFGLNKKGCGSGFLAGTHLQHAVRLSDSHDVVVVMVVLVFLNQVFFVLPDFSATKTESCILVLWLFCC